MSESVSESDALAAPLLPAPSPDKWRTEQLAFRRLLPDLLRTQRNQYVAIHESKVVESGPDKIKVARSAYARFGYIPIFVSLVTEEPLPVVRMPSPRTVRPEKSA